jgi:SOS-response transcriptional repressor LexA
VTPKQNNVYKYIEMYWKEFGYGPAIDDIMYGLGYKGRGEIHKIIKRLCEMGACKMIPNRARSVRPTHMTFRGIK